MSASATSGIWFSIETPRHPFDLVHCLTSGQSFAWSKLNGSEWIGSIRESVYRIRVRGNTWEGCAAPGGNADVTHLKHYLAWNDDLDVIHQSFPADPFLKQAMEYGRGLRILRQDPWECLAGFILSSSKQIAHIQKIWKKMSEHWGTKRIFPDGVVGMTFPSPRDVKQAGEVKLRACGMGFRAPYLYESACAVSEGRLDLKALADMSTAEARNELMQLPGVGRKIADCVLLFSFGKSEAFPIDTWILKVLKEIYFSNQPRVSHRQLVDFSECHFGPYAGYAQQYLFHYVRSNPHVIQTTLEND